MNVPTCFIGCVGDDSDGQRLLASLNSFGVNTSLVQTAAGIPSGSACVCVDELGENQIVVDLGANMSLSVKHLMESLSKVQPKVLVTQQECTPEVTSVALKWGRTNNVMTILNAAPAVHGFEECLRLTDFLIVNAIECQAISGILPDSEPKAASAALKLLSFGAKDIAITMGAKGVFWANHKASSAFIPAPAVNPVDTVGAGDCFVGCVAAYVASGSLPYPAIQRATAAASLSTLKHGAQPSMPSMDEVKEFAPAFFSN